MLKLMTIFISLIVAVAAIFVLPLVTSLTTSMAIGVVLFGTGLVSVVVEIDNGNTYYRKRDGNTKIRISWLTISGMLLIVFGVLTLLTLK